MVVRVVKAGDTIRYEHYDIAPKKGASVQRIDADHYMVLSTGEIREYIRSENRADIAADAYRRLRLSMRDMRDVVNANAISGTDILWITLTYAENMQDQERLYQDYRRFWQRFKRWLARAGATVPEYVVAAEPQERGAWHMHCLYFFHHGSAPWVPNEELQKIWGHGFVKVDKINTDVITNIGAYLSAYLSDTLTNEGKKNKGARLRLYPPRMRFWRASRGAYRPTVEWMSEEEAEIKKGSPAATLGYQGTKKVKLRNGRAMTIFYEHYTLKEGRGQE